MDFTPFMAGAPAALATVAGFAAIIVALGIFFEAIGTAEEKAASQPVLKQMRTIAMAFKAFGGLAALFAATLALASADQLKPYGWPIAITLLAIIVFLCVVILIAARRVADLGPANITTTSPVNCEICGHSVATIHTIATH
ncbi:hypothetical protein [Pseudarthrobacter sp. NIBRBAC000502770]|uniref:hypothetical protein n=1 Tax=Pseudarthrobacter sp. NIBRBAC000502770 TaxID=2590785 RepID=UPI001140222F|nr:hypothetical protein [Pseudarthrobacter sp. NIBRBAC000502770]QDG89945.1 hypothetical protein NIBR502770_16690 [Pseudarthrobacter sp. NIBRBAC000502770]